MRCSRRTSTRLTTPLWTGAGERRSTPVAVSSTPWILEHAPLAGVLWQLIGLDQSHQRRHDGPGRRQAGISWEWCGLWNFFGQARKTQPRESAGRSVRAQPVRRVQGPRPRGAGRHRGGSRGFALGAVTPCAKQTTSSVRRARIARIHRSESSREPADASRLLARRRGARFRSFAIAKSRETRPWILPEASSAQPSRGSRCRGLSGGGVHGRRG